MPKLGFGLRCRRLRVAAMYALRLRHQAFANGYALLSTMNSADLMNYRHDGTMYDPSRPHTRTNRAGDERGAPKCA